MNDASQPIAAVTPEVAILLVEPDEATGYVLEFALSARGHVVTVSRAAGDALEAVDRATYPIVVVDRRIPDLDADELCRRMRAMPHGRRSRIIMLADSFEPAEREDAMQAGASDCLVWPADATRLRAHLDEVEQAGRAVAAASAVPSRAPGEASMVLGKDGTIQSVDEAVADWLATTHGELLGVSAFGLFHLDDASELLGLSTRAMSTDGPTDAVVARVRGGDDIWRKLRLRAVNRLDDPDVRGIVLLASPEREDATAAGEQGLYDQTTGLASEALFLDRLEHALTLGRRRREALAVLAIDLGEAEEAPLDGKSAVRVAHLAGERIQSCLRQGDTAGRLEALEFAVLLEGLDAPNEATDIAGRLLRALGAPMQLDDAQAYLAPCIGIAIGWDSLSSADELLSAARDARATVAVPVGDDARFALTELGDRAPAGNDVAMAEQPSMSAAEAGAPSDEDVDVSAFWYAPLMDRISSLEHEIGRLQERRMTQGGALAGESAA